VYILSSSTFYKPTRIWSTYFCFTPSLCFFAGLDNELFYMDKTMMVFGDAKKVIEDMVKAVE